MIRALEERDLLELLELLVHLDDAPERRTMAPEARTVEELKLELNELSPFHEVSPWVLEHDGRIAAYVSLCRYEGEVFLEGPLIDGLSPQEVKPLIEKAVEVARFHGDSFVEAFVDEENRSAKEALEQAGFEPFRTTYIYELLSPQKRSLQAPKGVTFDLAGEIDVGEYRDLYRETSDNWANRLAWSDEELIDRFSDPDVHLILAYDHGELVGHLEFESIVDENFAEIAYFGVLPHARKRGIGAALLSQGIEQAFELEDVELLLARAHDDEREASKALEKLGFRLSHGVIAMTLELDEEIR